MKTKTPTEIENALKFHEEHLYFNPKVEHDLNKVMKLRGIMKVSEVRKLLKEVEMAYYCKLCQCWHYPSSAVYYSHKIYASQGVRPRKVVKRRKKSFWDRW